jgi:hypothetical protein
MLRPRSSTVLLRRPPISRSAANLVASPHPVSHIRPIIYNDVPPPPPPSFLPHPYSLAEFDPEPKTPQPANELLFKLQRQQLDDLNHHFWLDVRPRALLFLFSHILSRATPVSKQPRKQSLTASPHQPLLSRKNTPSPSSTSSGLFKNHPAQAPTPRSGEPRIGPPSTSPPVCPTAGSSTGYLRPSFSGGHNVGLQIITYLKLNLFLATVRILR